MDNIKEELQEVLSDLFHAQNAMNSGYISEADITLDDLKCKINEIIEVLE